MVTDPWTVRSSKTDPNFATNECFAAFEDNFIQSAQQQDKLPDTEEYLKTLEKKLSKLRTNTNVLSQLTARREQCMEHLLSGTITLPTDTELGIDLEAADNTDTRQLSGSGIIVRRILPEQAVNPGELVHIIKYDQLEQQLNSASESNIIITSAAENNQN